MLVGSLVEIKVKPHNNFVAWENLPVIETVKASRSLNTYLKMRYSQYKEIRWNYVGSTQGHYLTP